LRSILARPQATPAVGQPVSQRNKSGDTETMLDQIENFMNHLSDMDWGWWPVLPLRPAKDQEIDNVILLKLSLVFGSAVGVIFLLIVFFATGTMTFGTFMICILLGWLLFFVGYKATFVYFWNRRARRLRGN
jgi:hypothetical protein